MTAPFAVDTTDFRVEIGDDGLAEVILGAPGTMPVTDARGHAEIARIWSRLDAHPGVRAILVRSEGKGFCAGGHTDLVEDLLASEATRWRVLREARELVQGMIDCDKPIVSAIHGAAVGAGAAVALLADVSVAATTAKIIDGHTKLGVAAGDHAAVIWPFLCGVAKAKYHLLLCETVSGAEAERIGLVSLAVEPDALQATARDIAQRLAAGSQTALAATKRTINHSLRLLIPAFEASLAHEILGFAGADAREGLQAVKDKRAAAFPGAATR
ncbi:enoyl-CoA hydratase/isomerase family protein [Caldimonas sp. KR1-144]|uniref:enoyl-CoA hydratase/isomerase family protein n=1 Tax=Caldimonas sp. KR1-144 TaxID=3400911 RepID=UPI003C078B36